MDNEQLSGWYVANTQLKRIADAIEEILRLVKQDQEASAARQRQNDNEQASGPTNGQDLSWPLALARGPRTKLQGPSHKLQASSCKLDKIKL